jgi:NADPH:quinone reductase-like Zn-dependent oxidoreductase
MAGVAALLGLRDAGEVRNGSRVLINGAAGGVGSFAVPLAATMGATVTAVSRPAHLSAVSTWGNPRVIDSTRENLTALGQTFDLVVDIAGNRRIRDLGRVLAPDGICLVVGFSTFGHLVATVLGRRARLLTVDNTIASDLPYLADLACQGAVVPVIDRIYPFAEAQAALTHLHTGHPTGKITVSMSR